MAEGRIRVTITYEVPWSAEHPQQVGSFTCETLHEWHTLIKKYETWRKKREKMDRSAQSTGHFAGKNGVLLFSDNIISVTRGAA